MGNDGAPALAVSATGLRRSYDDVLAVDGLDLSICPGDLFALLGPNGSGKTTTIGMLCCLLHPDAGSAEVLGRDVAADPLGVKSVISVVPQETAVAEHLTGLTAGPHPETGCPRLGQLQPGHQPQVLRARLPDRRMLPRHAVAPPRGLRIRRTASTGAPGRTRPRSAGTAGVLEPNARCGSAAFPSASHIIGDLLEVCETVGATTCG